MDENKQIAFRETFGFLPPTNDDEREKFGIVLGKVVQDACSQSRKEFNSFLEKFRERWGIPEEKEQEFLETLDELQQRWRTHQDLRQLARDGGFQPDR